MLGLRLAWLPLLSLLAACADAPRRARGAAGTDA